MRNAVRGFALPTSLLLAIAGCSSDGVVDTSGGDEPGSDGGLLGDDGGEEGPTIPVCASGDADYQTIGDAIAAAPAGAVLALCAGTYQEQLLIEGKSLTIRGTEGATATALDAGERGIAITLRATGNGGLTVEGLTIRGGDNGGGGGGIRCETSGLRLINDVLRGNRAGAGGGGLFASGCELDVSGTAFMDNDGAERGGGALLVDSSGQISGSHFEGNRAVYGGGVTLTGGSVALRSNQVKGNAAELRGGGVYIDSDATVEENLITGNTSGWTGGGVHIMEHAPVLRANQVKDNEAVNDGGGIYLHKSSATITDCDITGNRSGDDGGGIRLFESSARVEGNRIASNTTADGGGGIRVSHVASTFIDNDIHDNQAYMGGGMDMDNDSSVVQGGVVADNQATIGGGISATRYPWNGSLFDGVRVSGNRADDGGGMYLENNFVQLDLSGVELVGNQASRGGGLFVRATNVTVHNTVFDGNQADQQGGALYVGQPEPWTEPCPCPPTSPSIDLDFAVIHQNRAGEGGALWAEMAGLTVTSSILSGNQAPAVVAQGGDPAWSYNDTSPASFSGMTNPTGSDGNISADPQYADQSFRLAGGSPCVNAGDPSLADPDGSRADMGRFGGPEAPE
jgi:predicted outer membrane repeat protein